MEWESIEYVEEEQDTFTTIDFMSNSIYYIEHPEYKTYNNIIHFLQDSYKKKGSLTRQIKVDFPRLECYINNTRINTLQNLIQHIQHIPYKKELYSLCTQTSLFPITYICYQIYTNFEKRIHLSDKKTYPIQIYIDLQKNTISLYKTFRVIYIHEREEEEEIETIKTCTFLSKDTNTLSFTYIRQ